MQREEQGESPGIYSTDEAAGRPPRRARPFDVTSRDVWKITLPMTAAYLTTPLLGLTDTAIVGRIGDAAALAGLAVGAIIFDFVFATFNFLRSGTLGLTAFAFGAQDGREVQAIFWRALLIAVTVGLAVILAEPLLVWLGLLAVSPGEAVAQTTRAYVAVRIFSAPFALMNYAILGHVLGRGEATLGLVLQAIINGTNIALSVLFGFVLGWGIAGVALGTVLGEAIGALAGLAIAIGRFDSSLRPSRRRIFDSTRYRRMIAVNRDIMIRSFCLLSGMMLFARLGAQFGAVVLAANAILINLFLVASFFLDGLATAAEQLVGKAVGALWPPAFDSAVRLTMLWSFVLCLVLAAIFYALGGTIVDFLTTEEAVREMARLYLPWAALTPIAGALAFQMDGVYIGATWSRTMRDMMVLSLLVLAVSAAILVPLLSNHGLWAAFLLFLGFRGISLLGLLPRRRAETFG